MLKRIAAKSNQHPDASALAEGIKAELPRRLGVVYSTSGGVLGITGTVTGNHYMEVVFWAGRIVVTNRHGENTNYTYDDPETIPAIIAKIGAELSSWPEAIFPARRRNV